MAVTKEVQKVIEATVEQTMSKINTVSWIERQKIISQETFKNTEKLLYSYNALKEHVSNAKEYMEMYKKGKSKSVVIYQTAGGAGADEEQMMSDREESYIRSKRDLERIEKALRTIQGRKGYEVIVLRYLTKKSDDTTYTFEEIAEQLAGTKGYGTSLAERTVRTYRSMLVKEIAIQLFGTDAI